jgi:Flp pilus assembly protein TadG
MFGPLGAKRREARTFLGRLRSDVRGNTLAMMAIALIPMAALAGSGVDMARLYVVKVRLQQACDAGVLAGRKFMSTTSGTTLDSNAATQATTFFNNNFASGWMKTNTVVFTPTKTSDNQVSGTASAVVPMTVMKMFAAPDTMVSVTCTARYDVADTDVLFVLDTTGSMACAPADSDSTCNNYVGSAGNSTYTRPTDTTYSTAGYSGSTGYSVPEKSGSRIEALRQAVLSFYDTFAANADPSTHVRYGFVTYTSAVNSGKAVMSLDPTFVLGGSGAATNYNYQSRKVTADYTTNTATANNSMNQATCNSQTTTRSPATALTYTTSSTATQVSYAWNSGTLKCVVTTKTLGPQYTYSRYPWDVSQFVAGNTVDDPTKVDSSTTKWPGCLEERIDATSAGQTVFNTASLPKDIDPDFVPNSDATRWAPQWGDVEYGRNNYNSTSNTTSNGDDSNNDPNYGSTSLIKSGYLSCGKPVRRLTTWQRTDVYNYLYATDFKPIGGTYHDTGMIWGLRLISPTGLFKADTAPWGTGAGALPPNRVIVLLTDGFMAPTTDTYSMYGVEYFDKRVTGGDYSNITNYHNARFLAACSAAKARNIDIWTISIQPTASSQMQSCATTTAQALATTSGTGLSTAFANIAQHLAMLRLTH